MALDGPKDTDDIFDVKGFQFVVDKEFMGKAENIKIDFTGMGFSLNSAIEFDQSVGCAGCGSNTSCS